MSWTLPVMPIGADEAVCKEDRKAREYLAGVRKLRAWHEECRRKRNGTFVPNYAKPQSCNQGRTPKATANTIGGAK